MRRTEMLLLVIAVAISACGDGSDETAGGAIRDWDAPSDYSFTVDSRCGEQTLIGTIRIEVRDGKVVGADGIDDSGRSTVEHAGIGEMPTLSQLLDYAREAEGMNADVLQVAYDEGDGHPTHIEIDYEADSVDDESCYEITDYGPG